MFSEIIISMLFNNNSNDFYNNNNNNKLNFISIGFYKKMQCFRQKIFHFNKYKNRSRVSIIQMIFTN